MNAENFSTVSLKAVIFDLDGTLLDTLDDLAESLNAMLAGLGYRQHSVEAVKGFIGDGMENLVRRAAPEDAAIDDALVARCLSVYKEEYGKRWNVKTRAYEGIPVLLAELQRRGVPMGVLSNKADAFTKLCIAEYFPGVTFSAVLGQREGIPKKPDPSGALEIGALWGFPVDEVAFVGDSPVDIRTATGAGMFAVGVDWGFRPAAQLRDCGAATILGEPGDLLRYFGRESVLDDV